MTLNTRMSATTVRRGLYGMFAGGLLGGIASAAIVMPTANAAPPAAQCNASEVATTQSSVQLSMSTYLQTHPQTDQALTDISMKSPTQAEAAYQMYFADNPQVAKDLKGLQQPVSDLTTQCGIQAPSNQLTDALKSA